MAQGLSYKADICSTGQGIRCSETPSACSQNSTLVPYPEPFEFNSHLYIVLL